MINSILDELIYKVSYNTNWYDISNAIMQMLLVLIGALGLISVAIIVKQYIKESDKSKKERRRKPSLSIWDDLSLNVTELKKKDKENRIWICKLSEVNKFKKNRYLCCLFRFSNKYYIKDSTFEYWLWEEKNKNAIREDLPQHIGFISADDEYILPIPKVEGVTIFFACVGYKNEDKDDLKYIAVIELDQTTKKLKKLTEIIIKKINTKKQRDFCKDIELFGIKFDNEIIESLKEKFLEKSNWKILSATEKMIENFCYAKELIIALENDKPTQNSIREKE